MQSGGEVDNQPIKEFHIKTLDKAFLFGDEITKYLKEVDKKARKLIAVTIRCNDLPVGDERSKVVNEQMGITDWFNSQYFELETTFAPCLKFKVWRES